MKKWIVMLLLSVLLTGVSEHITAGKGRTVTPDAKDAVLEEKEQKQKGVLPSQEEWKSAYEAQLDELYKQKDAKYYAVRDLDANGVPELIIQKYPKIIIYTYEQEMQQIYEGDFVSGTCMFLVSDHASCPGIFHFWVGGGMEHYGYLSMTDSTVHDEELWNEDYSGISKKLGEDRERILEISGDAVLIQESKKAYEERKELYFQKVSQHNEIEMLEGKMVIKPEAENVMFAFEEWVNKMVWMLGTDIYLGEQEYLNRDKTAEIYCKRLDAGKQYAEQAYETYLYFPYKNKKHYECFTFVMDMDGFAKDPLKRDSDCKTIPEELTYLGAEEFYYDKDMVEQPYYLSDRKTALLERIEQQLTEEFLSWDEEEDPWKQKEVYIMDFDAEKDGSTQAVIVEDQKEIYGLREVTWNVMLENGKISDKIDYRAFRSWEEDEEYLREMMDSAIDYFVIRR